MKILYITFICIISYNITFAQKWVIKDSILIFPQNFYSWLKRNNGGIDTTVSGNVGNYQPGKIGTNQGIDVFDFNKDGLKDLTFEIHPHNTITREYLKGIFLQNKEGRYILDTNYVIKGKGDMWYGGYADFNGDGLMDYHYITSNYHGADSNRQYNPEMRNDNWPDRVFINNGKSFDTLSLDINNLKIMSTYTSDIDNDGADEIIATSGEYFKYNENNKSWINSRIAVYKYDKGLKRFYEIETELPLIWNEMFTPQKSEYSVFSIEGINNKNEFYVTMLDSLSGGGSNWDYKKFTLVNYNFSTKKITKYPLNRDSLLIPENFSKAGADNPKNGGDDYFKFMIHNISYASLTDLDMNGEKEVVVGGFYQNNHRVSTPKYAYGWKVLGLNGKDITNQYFNNNGIDRGVDLISHSLDIDENYNGPEWLPGVWGVDPKYYVNGDPTLGYYYTLKNGKMNKELIRDIMKESRQKLDSNYFFEMQVVKYPNYINNKNAILLFDFWNIKRSAILYQLSCKGTTKPVFEKSKYFLCGDDSVSIKINNFSKNDSTAWYKNNKLLTTNIQQQIFKSTDTIYVTKIDSNGCSKTSDVLIIDKYPKPSTPILSRDSDNNLVSNSTSNIWYKDGVKIADTTQKIKPTSNGIYTATTTQNGCTSALSQGYYYITNAVPNLSNGEYFRISPNPTSGELNINYRFSSGKDVYISVIDMNGRNLILNRKINSGSKINIGSFSKGNYIIQVNDKTGRLITSQKVVKE